MADTYTWGVANMERKLSDEAVYTIHWTATAERTVSGETLTASSYGSVGLGEPDPQDFIPYEDLTPAIVTDWAQEKLGIEQVEAIESALSGQLDSKETPQDASGVPW